MEISKVCNVAGDWPTGSSGGITEPIWLQILMLNPQKGGKKGNLDCQWVLWLLKVGEAMEYY